MEASLSETLTKNAQFIPNDNKTKCEENCKSEQEALVSCLNSIRDASEISPQSHDSDESPKSSNPQTENSCLLRMVSSWTECCSKANHQELLDAQDIDAKLS